MVLARMFNPLRTWAMAASDTNAMTGALMYSLMKADRTVDKIADDTLLGKIGVKK